MVDEKKPVPPPPVKTVQPVVRPEDRQPNNPTGAPLEGTVREEAARKTALADEAAREGKAALTETAGGKLTEGDKIRAKQLVGENVMEDKNSEAVKADLSSALASPGVTPADANLPPSRTIQRPDGTITTADRQDETARYIHGSRVMMRNEEWDKYKALTEAVNELQDGRGISDIPTSDIYWEKKKELDAYVARLRH